MILCLYLLWMGVQLVQLLLGGVCPCQQHSRLCAPSASLRITALSYKQTLNPPYRRCPCPRPLISESPALRHKGSSSSPAAGAQHAD